MIKRKVHRLGELQLKILKHLWGCAEATAAAIHDAVGRPGSLAFTTTATMLRKMEQRGLVRHRTEGRAFIYTARVSENEVSQSMAHDLVEKLFQGSVAQMLSHVLSTREISADELKQLEELIKAKKRRKE